MNLMWQLIHSKGLVNYEDPVITVWSCFDGVGIHSYSIYIEYFRNSRYRMDQWTNSRSKRVGWNPWTCFTAWKL